MSVISDLLAVLSVGREANRKLDLLLAGQQVLMTAFDDLKNTLTAQGEKLAAIGAAQASEAESLANVSADVQRLLAVIAGAGDAGLTPEQTAEVQGLATGINDALGTAAATAQQLATDLAAAAAVVPEV